MSDKTKNQIYVNNKLTSLLNEDAVISNFNVFAINMISEELKAIEWDEKFGDQRYWFFVKGGTALRLILGDDVTPASDWDTQIVINPDYSFDVWYEALVKIETAVNAALIKANMLFSLLPGNSDKVKEAFPIDCNTLDLVSQEWNGEIKYRQSPDRKTAYLCEMFHPLQSGDVGRRRFASLSEPQWKDAETLGRLFDQMYPRETVEVNQQGYRTLCLWNTVFNDFKKFVKATGWPIEVEDDSKLKKNYEWVRWSMERVTELNKAEAIEALKTLFDITLASSSSTEDVRAMMLEQYKDESVKLLASGQKTLIIEEFYLYRLVVRYKYHKPVKAAINKQPQDYAEAWSASGNLRGELIDVTVPRRDTFETRHHGALLKSGVWTIELKGKSLSADGVAVQIPVLSNQYHIEEQVLIVREILAGKSSSPKKIHKRLSRGYALASNKINSSIGRQNARTALINIMNEQFVATYSTFANVVVNDFLAKLKLDLFVWSDREVDMTLQKNVDIVTALKGYFDTQCERSADHLRQTDLLPQKLDNLKTFMKDVSNLADYKDVWGIATEDDANKNAGCLDFFMITTIYANAAEMVKVMLSGVALDLSIKKMRRSTDPREIIKAVCNAFANNEHLYPQVTGKAASFFHLKELDEVFGDVDVGLLVDTIDIRVIQYLPIATYGKSYRAFVDLIRYELGRVGLLLLTAKKISEYKVLYIKEENAHVLKVVSGMQSRPVVQIYMRIKDVGGSHRGKGFFLSEYAYGIPVINLDERVRTLQNEIGASEFLQSQAASDELIMLQKALTVREYSKRYDNMPRLKRSLSSSKIQLD